jgi:hypothetical protein
MHIGTYTDIYAHNLAPIWSMDETTDRIYWPTWAGLTLLSADDLCVCIYIYIYCLTIVSVECGRSCMYTCTYGCINMYIRMRTACMHEEWQGSICMLSHAHEWKKCESNETWRVCKCIYSENVHMHTCTRAEEQGWLIILISATVACIMYACTNMHGNLREQRTCIHAWGSAMN